MRVLVASEFNASPYVAELCQALRVQGVIVDSGLKRFWLNEGRYDIVHLQWPEALFEWKSTDWIQMRSLFHDILPAWRTGSRIVITRHNAVSHLRNNEYWSYLYSHIYDYVDGVVHLGESGIDQFRSEYGNAVHCDAVIPIHTLDAYGDSMDSGAARKRLNISSRTKVILAFGAMRHDEERHLLLEAFTRLTTRKKLLLVPSFGSPMRPSRRNPLKWFAWELKHHELFWPRRLRLGRSSVPADMVKFYFSAADVILIPRIDTLNSAVVPLAFQFGKVVAGPDVGNMGPILKAAGNPTFDPMSVSSCISAIESALQMASQGLGLRNAIRAKDLWAKDKVARMHKDFYESVLR